MRECAAPGCGRQSLRPYCPGHQTRVVRYGELFPEWPIQQGRHLPLFRYPIAPLLERISDLNNTHAAQVLGVSRRTVIRWRQRPHHAIWLSEADRIAARLGEHLDEIWDEPITIEEAAAA